MKNSGTLMAFSFPIIGLTLSLLSISPAKSIPTAESSSQFFDIPRRPGWRRARFRPAPARVEVLAGVTGLRVVANVGCRTLLLHLRGFLF